MSEDDLSAHVKTWLDKLNELHVIHTVHFHVPNEFKPTKNFQAAWSKKKKIGCVAGAPDWVVAWSGGVLFIELKVAKTQAQALKKMREGQKDMAKSCEETGIHYAVVFDKDSLVTALEQAGIFI